MAGVSSSSLDLDDSVTTQAIAFDADGSSCPASTSPNGRTVTICPKGSVDGDAQGDIDKDDPAPISSRITCAVSTPCATRVDRICVMPIGQAGGSASLGPFATDAAVAATGLPSGAKGCEVVPPVDLGQRLRGITSTICCPS